MVDLTISRNKDYDTLVHIYKDPSTGDRDKGKILEVLAKKYYPKMRKISSSIPARDQEDFYQIYRIRIIEAMYSWKEKSLFTTYLFIYLKRTLRIYLSTCAKDSWKATQIISVGSFSGKDIISIQNSYSNLDWQYSKPVTENINRPTLLYPLEVVQPLDYYS